MHTDVNFTYTRTYMHLGIHARSNKVEGPHWPLVHAGYYAVCYCVGMRLFSMINMLPPNILHVRCYAAYAPGDDANEPIV